jgi:hypothetical protein
MHTQATEYPTAHGKARGLWRNLQAITQNMGYGLAYGIARRPSDYGRAYPPPPPPRARPTRPLALALQGDTCESSCYLKDGRPF